MQYTITSDGGKIRRGDSLEYLLSEFDARPNGTDGGAVTVFEGDSTNVLFYGNPRKAAAYITAHPEHRKNQSAKLNTETNTPAMEARILKAVKKTLVNPAYRYVEFRAIFEHGQWWITHLPSGAQWSVCDASGPSCPDGFDFEQVTQGSEE